MDARLPHENLTDEELLFGASIMWQVYCARPVADEDHARFIDLYGCLGSTFLYIRAVRSWETQLLAGDALFSYVPKLRRSFLKQAEREVAQALQRAYESLAPQPAIHSRSRSPLPQLAHQVRNRPVFTALSDTGSTQE